MPETTLRFLVLIAICLLPGNEVCSLNEEESCVSYGPGAGSHVYPVGSKSDGHQLQYTKAVSKFIANTMFFYSLYNAIITSTLKCSINNFDNDEQMFKLCKNYTFSDYSS